MKNVIFKTSKAIANESSAMEQKPFEKQASLKSQINRGISKYAVLALFLVVISGCSVRIVDFTIISSKNHSLAIDKTKGVQTTGDNLQFLGLGTSIKGAMDKALENAGLGYDLLIDGVVYQQSYFFVSGFRVTGVAIRSGDLKARLGEEGFMEWLKGNNVFDPATAIAQKEI